MRKKHTLKLGNIGSGPQYPAWNHRHKHSSQENTPPRALRGLDLTKTKEQGQTQTHGRGAAPCRSPHQPNKDTSAPKAQETNGGPIRQPNKIREEWEHLEPYQKSRPIEPPHKPNDNLYKEDTQQRTAQPSNKKNDDT